jgi:hypothetical protein
MHHDAEDVCFDTLLMLHSSIHPFIRPKCNGTWKTPMLFVEQNSTHGRTKKEDSRKQAHAALRVIHAGRAKKRWCDFSSTDKSAFT